ncbi:hypothetical protein CROQUDRAFT_100990 [Cronartium quercuum f. sp. fusiforme G11]|uniref:Uncharacterized protein n=1 Tax=Cronartium quercuum f. sp. fusiforme G11 TaxID=708437 RepID=A0A9P6N5Q2_9BASI|nr:hypothetical protein CROQUDRAFT_100990 [Cronartium quercuum f. sp. fusiforme G11]
MNNLIASCYFIDPYGKFSNRKGDQKSETQVQLHISLIFLKAQARKLFGTRGVPLNRPPYVTTGKKISDAFAKLEKGQAAAISQLRSRHSPLRHYLKRIQAEKTAMYPHCELTETTAHFLVYCKAYVKARRKLWNRLRKDKIRMDYKNAAKLLDIPSFFKHLWGSLVNFAQSPNRRLGGTHEEPKRTPHDKPSAIWEIMNSYFRPWPRHNNKKRSFTYRVGFPIFRVLSDLTTVQSKLIVGILERGHKEELVAVRRPAQSAFQSPPFP